VTFFIVQGGSNMTGTDLCVNKPHLVPVIFEIPRTFPQVSWRVWENSRQYPYRWSASGPRFESRNSSARTMRGSRETVLVISVVRLQLTCLDMAEESNITKQNMCCLSAMPARACVVPCCEDSLGAVPLFWEIHSNGLELAFTVRTRKAVDIICNGGEKKWCDKCVKKSAHGAKVRDVTTLLLTSYPASVSFEEETKNGRRRALYVVALVALLRMFV